jgi:hypothetical protein
VHTDGGCSNHDDTDGACSDKGKLAAVSADFGELVVRHGNLLWSPG